MILSIVNFSFLNNEYNLIKCAQHIHVLFEVSIKYVLRQNEIITQLKF